MAVVVAPLVTSTGQLTEMTEVYIETPDIRVSLALEGANPQQLDLTTERNRMMLEVMVKQIFEYAKGQSQ